MFVGVDLDLLEPLLHILKTLQAGYVKDQQRNNRTTSLPNLLLIIRSYYRLEALLPRRVPNHRLDDRTPTTEDLGAKLDTQGGFVVVGELVVDEFEQKGALAYV